MRVIVLAVSGLAGLSLRGQSTMTFDTVAAGTPLPFNGTYQQNGLVVRSKSNNSQIGNPLNAGSGNNFLYFHGASEYVEFSLASGASFNLNSLKLVTNGFSARWIMTSSSSGQLSLGAPTSTTTIQFSGPPYQNIAWFRIGTPSFATQVDDITVTPFVPAAPAIVTQPASQTIAAGNDLTLSVSASGSPAPTYQWYKDGGALPGATAPTLSFPEVTPAATGAYSVVATNSVGTATSNPANVVVTTPVPVTPPSGIIAWLPLDETSGLQAADRMGRYPAAYASGPVPASGRVRGGLRFNGTNYLNIQDSDDWAFGTRDFSIEFWVNFDQPPGGSVGHPSDIFIGNDEGPGSVRKWFFALGGGVLNFHLNSPSIGPKFFPQVPFTPAVGKWYHLALVRSGSLYTIFVNGSPLGSAVNADPVPNPNAPLTIGQAEQIGFTRSRMDEVTIYSRALSDEEVRAIYDAGSAGKQILLTIQPNTGGNAGNVSVRINGNGLQPSTVILLRRAAAADVAGQTLVVSPDGTVLTAVFDLTGQPSATWDVVLQNTATGTQTIPSGFITTAVSTRPPTAEIVGLGLTRTGRSQSYWLRLSNEGNVDTDESVFAVSWPSGVEFKFDTAVTAYQQPTPPPAEANGLKAQGLFVPRIAAGQTLFYPATLLSNGNSGQTIDLSVAPLPASFLGSSSPSATVAPPLGAGTPPVGSTVFMGPSGDNPYGHEGVVGSLNGVLGVWDNFEAANSSYTSGFVPFDQWKQIVGGTYVGWGTPPGWTQQKGDQANAFATTLFSQGAPDWELTAGKNVTAGRFSCSGLVEYIYEGAGLNPFPTSYEMFLTPGAHYRYFTGKKDFYQNAQLVDAGVPLAVWWINLAIDFYGNGLIDALRRSALAKTTHVTRVSSFDPNDIVGPQGAGPERYIRNDAPLTYLISFENLPAALAAAQEVVVSTRLDAQAFDLSSGTLGPVTIANHSFLPPQAGQSLVGAIDLRPTINLIVRITAVLDPNTGILTWRFESIDPATSAPTQDPILGFLPPNHVPPEGEGSVLFTLKPRANLGSGSVLSVTAGIVFDTNAPISTPEWRNTIDAVKPTSRVSILSPTQTSATFSVGWGGDDVGSGVASYTIYVSDNGQPFTAMLTDTALTSTAFTGSPGHTYGFYSMATDRVGNIEQNRNMADTSTTVEAGGQDVTSQLQLTPGTPVLNRVTQRYAAAIKVKNMGAQPITAPLSLVFDQLGANATLFSPAGTTNATTPRNSPYINADVGADGVLTPGETITRIVEFSNPSNQPIVYQLRVLAGSGPR